MFGALAVRDMDIVRYRVLLVSAMNVIVVLRSRNSLAKDALVGVRDRSARQP